MAPRKRPTKKGKVFKAATPTLVEKTQKKAPEAPQVAAEEAQSPSSEFAHEMTQYRVLDAQIEALKASIADELDRLTKKRDAVKANLTDLLESSGVRKMESDYGTVTLVRPTRHEVDDDYLREHLPSETWDAITETTTSVVQKKFEQAIVDGLISREIFSVAVKEVPANKGHTKITLRSDESPAR